MRTRSYDNPQDGIDYEAYYELAENGLSDKDIAREMQISESFLENIKRPIKEDY
jgi:DNA-binding CsgD family transcriptional regulator